MQMLPVTLLACFIALPIFVVSIQAEDFFPTVSFGSSCAQLDIDLKLSGAPSIGGLLELSVKGAPPSAPMIISIEQRQPPADEQAHPPGGQLFDVKRLGLADQDGAYAAVLPVPRGVAIGSEFVLRVIVDCASQAGCGARCSSPGLLVSTEGAVPAQRMFFGQQYPTNVSALAIAAGDVDLDGDTDFIIGDAIDGTVTVYEGRGDGVFARRVNSFFSFSASDVELADLNGDGLPEILVIDRFSDSVGVSIARGALQYSPFHVVSSEGSGPFDIIAQDINSDGLPEVIVANFDSSDLCVFSLERRGSEKPGLELISRVSVPEGPRGLKSVRVSGEGVALAVACQLADRVALVFDVEANDQAHIVEFGAAVLERPTAVAVGDFNSDEIEDYAVFSLAEDTCWVFVGGGGRSTPVLWNSTPVERGVTVAKVTKGSSATQVDDPNLEVVALNALEDTVTTYRVDSQGALGQVDQLMVGQSARDMALLQADQGGAIDIAVVAKDTNVASVYFRKPSGRLQRAERYALPGNPLTLTIGDISGDHIDDCIVVSRNPGSVSVLIGRGEGLAYEAPVSIGFGSGFVACDVIDVDHDGQFEVVMGNINSISSGLVVLGGWTGSGFSDLDVYPGSTGGVRDLCVGDVNGDGFQDVVVVSALGDSVSVFLGQPDGQLSSPVVTSLPAGAVRVAAGDITGDGALEVGVVLQSSNQVGLLTWSGTSLAPPTLLPAGATPWDVLLSDLNSDGFADVVTSTENGRSLAVYLSNGMGGMVTPPKVFPNPLTGFDIAFGDFDGDGLYDVALENPNGLSVLLGDGTGSFGPALGFASGQGTEDLAVIRGERGRALGVVLVNRISGDVSVLRNSNYEMPDEELPGLAP